MRATRLAINLAGPVVTTIAAVSPAQESSPPSTRAASRNLPGAAIVASRLVLRGEVSGEGDFQILGKFEGEINVTGKVLVA